MVMVSSVHELHDADASCDERCGTTHLVLPQMCHILD